MTLTQVDIYEMTVVGICLLASAFFSASETAITSLGSLKAKHMLDSNGKSASGHRELNLWLNHPGRVLSTILVFNNVVNILASVVTADLTARYFESQAIGIATGVTTILILIFGEVVPKSFAKAHHERLAPFFLKSIYLIYLVSAPVTYTLSEFALRVVRLFGNKAPETPPITEEELEFLVNVGERAGVLEETKKEMMLGVFEFDETKVREIMTPRTDAIFVSTSTSIEEALGIAIETGFSRIPIYDDEKGIDHVVGVLLVKDLLRVARAFEQHSSGNGQPPPRYRIPELMREPYFIPEAKRIIDVFRDLKRSKNHMAIVIDEHGGTSGVVTMEDILEEIVGEIQDEYDVEEAEILEIEAGIYDVAGSVSVDDFLEFFQLEEEEVIDQEQDQDFDTLAGWVTELLGDLPETGKTVRIGPLSVEVTEVEDRRVQRLRISRILSQGEEEAESALS